VFLLLLPGSCSHAAWVEQQLLLLQAQVQQQQQQLAASTGATVATAAGCKHRCSSSNSSWLQAQVQQ
jgi:hypothetical protein